MYIWEEIIYIYIYEKSLEICICLWPEFDCPEVTLCGWQDIKIQLLTVLTRRADVSWKALSVESSPWGTSPWPEIALNQTYLAKTISQPSKWRAEVFVSDWGFQSGRLRRWNSFSAFLFTRSVCWPLRECSVQKLFHAHPFFFLFFFFFFFFFSIDDKGLFKGCLMQRESSIAFSLR